MPDSFLILPFLRESPAVNMATDLWLFQEYPDASLPRFRRFAWDRPSVTFGYGQDFPWVLEETKCAEIDLCRRPTGGGIVKHGEDWTYSLVFPPSHPVCEGSASEVYLYVHRAISVSFAKCGVDTVLLPCKEGGCSVTPRKVIPGQCFFFLVFLKKNLLFLELILEFFGAKRQFFLEVIFGVFESLDLWSSNIISSETHKIEREIASETLYMDFFRRCAALLSQKVITN